MFKISKYLLIIALSFFIVGCSQVINTRYDKGNLLNETSTGKSKEFERYPVIELINPTEVRLFEKVTTKEEFEQIFEKSKVETIADKKASCVIKNEFYRPLFTLTVVLMFMPEYWSIGFIDCTHPGDLSKCCDVRNSPNIENLTNERIIDKVFINDSVKN